MIADLLPRYMEARRGRREPEWTVERSIPIDGHEVALMRFRGARADGSTYEGTDVKCECDFAEGVGWKSDDKFGIVSLSFRCERKRAACYLRRRELNADYLRRYSGKYTHASLSSALCGKPDDAYREILLNLIERAKAGEWLGEEGGGATFWGGYLYLQTAGEIVEMPMSFMWEVARGMVEDKLIGLEGAVVTPYREPTPPDQRQRVWENRLDGRYDVYVERVDGDWGELVVNDGERELLREATGLAYGAAFGPDVEDVRAWEDRAARAVDDG